jgi:hypothetical protein
MHLSSILKEEEVVASFAIRGVCMCVVLFH